MTAMRVILAPDSFKECLTAAQAAQAMARGVQRAAPGAELDLCPIADGGEGTVEAILQAVPGASRRTAEVPGPLPDQSVDAHWAELPSDGADPARAAQRLAVMEMAAAAGLHRVPPDRRDPTRTSTFGVGRMLAIAHEQGVPRVILGIGGSGTCDGGIGVAQALGWRLLDAAGRAVGQAEGRTRPLSGGDLRSVHRLEPPSEPTWPAVSVACDVTNPLLGADGAATVYAPQKGASPKQVRALEEGLRCWSEAVRRSLGVDVADRPGVGAAGGLGYGLLALLGAELESGIALVLRTIGFEDRLTGCDLCLTGEGRLDGQSLRGKACLGVARRAAQRGVPTVALVGSLGPGIEAALEHGLSGYRLIGPGLSQAESIPRAEELLERAAEQAVLAARSGAV